MSDEVGDAGCLDARRYTIHDIVRTFGISRTTVMYYESLGIVTPAREGEQARRTYSDADVFRLMGAMLFKNSGIQPKDLAAHLDGDPLTPERFEECARMVERTIAYQQAKLERLRLYERVCANVGAVGVTEVQAYYYLPDEAETGYRRFPKDETLDLFLAHMPLGGLGSLWDGNPFAEDPARRGRNRWGRTIPVRYASLVDDLDTNGLDTVGGRTCVYVIQDSTNIRGDEAGAAGPAACQAVRAYLREHGLVATGRAFCPFSLPSARRFVFPTCLPVRTA